MTNTIQRDYERMVNGVPLEFGARLAHQTRDVLKGFGYGAAGTLEEIGHSIYGVFDEVIPGGKQKLSQSVCLGRVPRNKAGIASAAIGAACTLATLGYVGYQFIRGMGETLVQ